MQNDPTITDPAAASEVLDRVFSCLSEPSRRRILALLREAGELKVGDIANAFAMSLNGVSKHLKVLERAGLIERQVRGREHWIRVRWQALEPAHTWLHTHRHFWTGRLDALAEHFQDSELGANDDRKPK